MSSTKTQLTVNRLQDIILDRFLKEQPNRVLSNAEMDNIYFVILGKLFRGETESDVEEYCKTVKLSKKKEVHSSIRYGY